MDGTNYLQLTTVNSNTIFYTDETVTRGNTYYYRVKASYPDRDSVYSNVAVGIACVWIQQFTSITPSARCGHSMVWDTVGQRVIMFGGRDESQKNDLWWYDTEENTWTLKTPATSPSIRYGHSMVWDQTGQRVIMFGGNGGGGYKNDLWWYDSASNTWTNKTPASSPSNRNGHSMVWDPIGQRVIMFGGQAASGYKNDLWWYDPTSGTTGAWIQMKAQDAVGSPSARYHHFMVWDTVGQRVIMFGGDDHTLNYKNDLWWYYPLTNTWVPQIITGNWPSVREWSSMVWDGMRVFMFGGDGGYYGYKNDLWWYEIGINTWRPQILASLPPARSGHSMVFDGTRIIMFGGSDGVQKNDLWVTTPLVPPPDAPSNLNASAVSSTQISLFWQDNSSNEYGFQIERSVGGISPYVQIATVGTGEVSYNDNTVDPLTEYYYQVRAYNYVAGGNSSYSAPANATTPAGIPNNPSPLNGAVISTTCINLSWRNVGSESGYEIVRKLGVTGTYSSLATVTTDIVSYSDTAVTSSNTYYYMVRAFSGLGNGTYSNEVSKTSVSERPLSADILPTNILNDGGIISIGYRFSPAVNGSVIALGRYIDSGTGNTKIILWNDLGTKLGEVIVSANSGWQWATLPAPISVTAGQFYRVSIICDIDSGNGQGDYWGGSFSMPASRGNINIDTVCYNYGLNAFPTVLYDDNNMYGWADIEFVAE
jgi:hypothetical protein